MRSLLDRFTWSCRTDTSRFFVYPPTPLFLLSATAKAGEAAGWWWCGEGVSTSKHYRGAPGLSFTTKEHNPLNRRL